MLVLWKLWLLQIFGLQYDEQFILLHFSRSSKILLYSLLLSHYNKLIFPTIFICLKKLRFCLLIYSSRASFLAFKIQNKYSLLIRMLCSMSDMTETMAPSNSLVIDHKHHVKIINSKIDLCCNTKDRKPQISRTYGFRTNNI